MSLRPRYSLLTLLVLTALVAGGVKLWYGPHHVVVRSELLVEEEYTYTRDWRGNKIKQGVYVDREYQANGTALFAIRIQCYRHGEPLPWLYELSEYEETMHHPPSLSLLDKTHLTPAERQDCEQTIRQETAQLAAQGSRVLSTLFLIEQDAGNEFWRVVPLRSTTLNTEQ